MREWEGKEWTQGLWYAVEQLVVWGENFEQAEFLISESGINEWEFRECLKESGYETETMTQFLDKYYNNFK